MVFAVLTIRGPENKAEFTTGNAKNAKKFCLILFLPKLLVLELEGSINTTPWKYHGKHNLKTLLLQHLQIDIVTKKRGKKQLNSVLCIGRISLHEDLIIEHI